MGRAMYPHEHEAYNATHWPGTRQLCIDCGEPTGRCEDDSIYWSADEEVGDCHGPLCEICHDAIAELVTKRDE